jgi:F-type H+-transporting ATPase subunit b
MNLILAVLQHEAAESPSVFNLSTNVSFWTLVIFVLLLFLLAKFAFPPILGYAAAREARIQDALDSARRDREEAQRLIDAQKQELMRAREESQQLIGEAQKAAERVRRDLLDKAKAEQEDILQRAKTEIEAERARAVDSLRREAVDLAIAGAGRLIEKKLDAQEDRRIVADFLANIKDADVAGKR